MIKHRVRLSIVGVVAGLLAAHPSRADLDEYVRRPDPAFSWKLEHNDTTPAGKIYSIALTSQVWKDITWTHQLRVYEPTDLKYPDAVLLFITGGSSDSKPSTKDHEQGFILATACGARVAVLPQVPNQPLLGGKKEDTLIAETFVRYLETKDEDWPLLFPMVKSAVKAMDAVQALAKEQGKPATRFVVSGGSKRGWTTWLTGAVDPRVIAIAPMVIPTLNMRAQNKHQLEVWGKYSEQIEDYVRRGLMEAVDTPEGSKLWKMIDPWTYRDRLTMPKLQINGTNDRYWTLDSLNIYWNDLKGPSYVVYLPNAGHGLNEHRDYAINGVGSLFRHVMSGKPMPSFTWKYSESPSAVTLEFSQAGGAKQVQLWRADAATQDLREARWKTVATANGERVRFSSPRPDQGYAAVVADLTFDDLDGFEYHLSTQIRVLGSKPVKD